MDEVKSLLESIGFGNYAQAFEEQGWDDIETVLEMSDDDIRTCITKPGHVKKLSLKIQKLRRERKEKDEDTTESTQDTKRNISVKTEFEGSSDDESKASEELHRNTTKASDRDKGENKLDITHVQSETTMPKDETAVMTEAGISEIGKNILADDANGDSFIEPAHSSSSADDANGDSFIEPAHSSSSADDANGGSFIEPANSSSSDKDSVLIKKRGTSKSEDIIQPKHLVTSASLSAMSSQETLIVCGEEIRLHRGDMPLFTHVSDSENVTIAKDVHVQHVTNQFESGYSSYKGQIRSVLKSDDEKYARLFVETRAYREAKDILEDEFWVVIAGNAGEGKTTMGEHLLRQYMQLGYEPIIITSVEDWKHLVKGDGKEQAKQFVLIDDIFGTISVDERKVNEWASLFEMIDKLLAERNGDLKVICTVRTLIYSEVKTKLSKFKCFRKMQIIDLSEECFALQENEKIKMLENYIKCYNIEIDLSEIQQISTITFSHGFPHCVKMYCTNLSLRQRGLEFFRNPIRLLENEFEILYECDKNSFFALVMLVVAVDKNILITLYSDEDQLASLRGVAESLLNISNTSVQDIRSAFGHMKNIYINVSDDDVISFSHPSFYELVCIVVTKRNPIAAVNVLDINFLAYNTKSHCYRKKVTEDIVILPKSCNNHLVKRFTQAVLTGDFLVVLNHDVWDDTDFIKLWISHVAQEQSLCENYDCVLLELLSLKYMNFILYCVEMLLSLFALHKHEEIIIAIIQYQTLQDFWSTTLGKVQLSKAVISASNSDCSTNLLELLVKYGADVHYILRVNPIFFGLNKNALSFAVENDSIEKAKVLLESGASIFINDGKSALEYAVDNQNLDMINLVLSHMKRCTADKNSHTQCCLYGENYSCTVSSYYFSCLSDLLITTSKNMSAMKELLGNLSTAGIILPEECLLHIISSTEQTEQVMEILTSCGYSLLNVWESVDYSVLFKSVKDPIKSIDVFRKFGLDINARDVDGYTILEKMWLDDMQENRHTLFSYLISQGINVNIQDEDGVTPVQTVLCSIKLATDCIDDVMKLIELSDVDRIEDKAGKNCFHYLAMSCHSIPKNVLERLVDQLLQKECNINKKDNNGYVPLHFCKLGMIEMFIEKGANTSITDSKKRSIPMVMMLGKHQNILDVLTILSQNRLDLTVTDVNGRNLLHYAGASRYSSTLKEQLFAFLKSKGVNINQKDKENKTPLIVLAQNPKCKSRLIRFMIQNGARISEKDNEGFTVLHHCIRSITSEKEKLATVESLSEHLCDEVIALFTLSLQFAGYSVISYFLNNLKSEAHCVFKMSKVLIHFNCKADVYHVVLLLMEKYGSDLMSLLAADDDFKKTLLVRKRKQMENPLLGSFKEIYVNGINVDWFLTVNCKTIPENLSSIENVGDIIFTNDDGSPEFSLAKTGHFKLLLFFLQHRSKQWIVNKKELPKFLNCLTACLDHSIVEEILRLLFHAEDNCTFYKTIAYSALNNWCKQPNLYPPCIRLMLEHGDIVAVNERNESLVFCVIETYIQNRQTLSIKNVNEIVMLLEEFNFKCDLLNEVGLTPLMYLLQNSDTNSEHLIDFLISKTENLNQPNHEGNNVLHYLISSDIKDEKKSDLVRIFFERGVCFLENNEGITPLDLFSYSRDPIYILTLKRFLHIKIEQHKLVNLLLHSIRCIHVNELEHSFIEVFEASKLTANSIVDITGSTFLAQSARWLSSELVSYFIQKGVATNDSDILGMTPIHRIIVSDMLSMCSVHKCIFFGEDAYAENEFQRRTFPLISEAQIEQMETEVGPNLHEVVLKLVNDALDCLHMLLEHEADPNMMDINGKTPLHYCAESPIFDAFVCPAMSLLISYGADVNLEDYEGRTPLMLCLQFEKSKYKRLNILINAGAKLFSENYSGSNVFHYAQIGIGKRRLWLLEKEMRKQAKDVESKR